jgi:cell shape-determining protein MreC
MKMNSLIKSKPRKNIGARRAFVLAIIFIMTVLLVSRLSPAFFGNIVESISIPLWRAKTAVYNSFSKTFSFLSTKDSLITENERLREEITEANVALLHYDDLIRENTLLKNLATSTADGITGRVISRADQAPFDTFVVELPYRGAAVGQKVVGSNLVMLGEIIEVNERTARVELYSSANVQTESVLSQLSVPLTLVGRGGGNFTVTVPKGLQIDSDDFALYPGIRSYILATVDSIEETEADSFKTVYLSYPLNIFELKWVRILNE